MSKPDFTPGPWKQHLVDDMTVVAADGSFVCGTAPEGYGSDADIDFATDTERCEANARLIAAAPDMYEALKQIRGLLFHASAGGARSKPTIAQLNKMLDLAGFALAKAEGR